MRLGLSEGERLSIGKGFVKMQTDNNCYSKTTSADNGIRMRK